MTKPFLNLEAHLKMLNPLAGSLKNNEQYFFSSVKNA